MTIGNKIYKQGDWFTLNGTKGNLYEGSLKMIDASLENKLLLEFLKFCDKYRRLKIRTNADTPEDSQRARMLWGRRDCGFLELNICFMA